MKGLRFVFWKDMNRLEIDHIIVVADDRTANGSFTADLRNAFRLMIERRREGQLVELYPMDEKQWAEYSTHVRRK